MLDFTFLETKQILPYYQIARTTDASPNDQLEIFKNNAEKATKTDFAKILGCTNDWNESYWTKTLWNPGPQYIDNCTSIGIADFDNVRIGIRPALPFSQLEKYTPCIVKTETGSLETQCFYYPRNAAPHLEQILLNREISPYLQKSNNTFTTNSIIYGTSPGIRQSIFNPIKHDEFSYYNKKRYVRLKIQGNALAYRDRDFHLTLSNDKTYALGDFVWIEVEPIKWLIDEKNDIAITKEIILSGIPFNQNNGIKDFNKTDIKRFMDEYLAKDLERTIFYDKPNLKKESPILIKRR